MSTHYFLTVRTYEKIAEARAEAAHDRLVLAAENARRKSQFAWSPVAVLFRSLASVFGHGRPALEGPVPAGHAR
jgi:hypothetical protein